MGDLWAGGLERQRRAGWAMMASASTADKVGTQTAGSQTSFGPLRTSG